MNKIPRWVWILGAVVLMAAFGGDPLPESAAATNEKSANGARVHVVVVNDTLSKLAKRYLGNASLWTVIYAANKAVIGSNPDLIYPGQELVIPSSVS